MDLKALIAKMDQIESKKILTEAEDRPAAKKTDTTWTDKQGNKHPATRVQGSKSVAADKEADKERKKHDKDLDEMTLRSSIAKELLKEFNVSDEPVEEFVDKVSNYFKQNAADYRARQASGELPPDGWNTEVNGPWMGKTQQVPVTSSDGKPVQAGSGGNVVSNVPVSNPPTAGGAGTKPADSTGAPGAQDDFTGVDAAVAAQAAQQADTTAADTSGTGQAAGPTDAEIAANNAALGNWTDQPDTTGAATKPADPAAPMGGINPTVLNRYKELLDKLEGAGKKPAAAPAKAPAKPAAGAGTKPAATPTPGGPKVPAASAGADSPAYDTQDPSNISSMPAAESVKLRDDQILAIIKNM